MVDVSAAHVFECRCSRDLDVLPVEVSIELVRIPLDVEISARELVLVQLDLSSAAHIHEVLQLAGRDGQLKRSPIGLAVEFLPESVLARTERLIAWWTPPQKRAMFFGTTQGDMAGINGAIFPQPSLVWLAMDHSLSIRALKENRRPAADTKLCVAPYWNVYDTGSVCLGSMRAPDAFTVAAIPQWERSFYESEFTHGNVGTLTRHPGGFEGLWKDLRRQRRVSCRFAYRFTGNGRGVLVWEEERP